MSVVAWLLVRLRQAGSGEVGEARRHPTAEEEWRAAAARTSGRRLVRTSNDSLEVVVDAWLKANGGGECCVLTECGGRPSTAGLDGMRASADRRRMRTASEASGDGREDLSWEARQRGGGEMKKREITGCWWM